MIGLKLDLFSRTEELNSCKTEEPGMTTGKAWESLLTSVMNGETLSRSKPLTWFKWWLKVGRCILLLSRLSSRSKTSLCNKCIALTSPTSQASLFLSIKSHKSNLDMYAITFGTVRRYTSLYLLMLLWWELRTLLTINSTINITSILSMFLFLVLQVNYGTTPIQVSCSQL